VEIEAVVEETTGGMLRNTCDTFVVRLQRIHDVEVSRIEYTFTRRPHPKKLSMEVSFIYVSYGSIP
jgi:hypothetical protein